MSKQTNHGTCGKKKLKKLKKSTNLEDVSWITENFTNPFLVTKLISTTKMDATLQVVTNVKQKLQLFNLLVIFNV
jgi:hypothetical protein